jgi:hypothetical protein
MSTGGFHLQWLPRNHPFANGLSIINHPAIGDPPFQEAPSMGIVDGSARRSLAKATNGEMHQCAEELV